MAAQWGPFVKPLIILFSRCYVPAAGWRMRIVPRSVHWATSDIPAAFGGILNLHVVVRFGRKALSPFVSFIA